MLKQAIRKHIKALATILCEWPGLLNHPKISQTACLTAQLVHLFREILIAVLVQRRNNSAASRRGYPNISHMKGGIPITLSM